MVQRFQEFLKNSESTFPTTGGATTQRARVADLIAFLVVTILVMLGLLVIGLYSLQAIEIGKYFSVAATGAMVGAAVGLDLEVILQSWQDELGIQVDIEQTEWGRL